MQRTGHIIRRCGSRQVASERNRYPHRSSPSLFPIASVMKSKSELTALRKRALAIASVNLALGFRAMLFSLGEKSVGWTLFVWFAGLEGISIGLLSGVGYSQVMLGIIPTDWKMPPLAGFFWSVLTFWAPIVGTFVFGLMLYTTLPDAARPASSLNGGNGAGLMQSFVTFFNAVGCVWLMVMLITRRVDRSLYESALDTAVDT